MESKTAKRKRKTAQVILLIALAVGLIIWMTPMIIALLTALRSNDEMLTYGFLSWPREFIIDNFIDAWTKGGLINYIPNSFIITIPSLVMTIFFASLSAYALAKFDFPGRKLILAVFIAGMMLPFQILLMPVFKLSEFLGIYDTYWALIGIHTAFQLGFCTFVLRNYMLTIPDSLTEAARIDGCQEFMIYWKIIRPLVIPAMAAIATLEFTWVFNEFLWPLLLIHTDKLMPVTAGLAKLKGQYVTDYGIITAGALLATVPTIAVFVALQRFFIEGLTMGSNK